MYPINTKPGLYLQLFSSAGRSEVSVAREALLSFPIRHHPAGPEARFTIVGLPMLILPLSA